MKSVILVHPNFDKTWPFAADHAHRLWEKQGGETVFLRLKADDTRSAGEIVENPAFCERLLLLGVHLTSACLDVLPNLREVAGADGIDEALTQEISKLGVRLIKHLSVEYWGQSVSEFGLALTLCGLRRIPQTHHNILTSQEDWKYGPPGGVGQPRVRGQQFGDDSRFVNGTIEGKRVRIVGAGNIASRYASFCHFLGADVAAWDPFASDPCFHRAGSRREYHLDELVKDADIFAPMVPLMDSTRGLITEAHINALPKGCLVVLITRADICDMPAIRRRVLADEISLAADVFDIEPLPLDDPLLGRHNVVHTPHNAGRTQQANERWAETLLGQFAPVKE